MARFNQGVLVVTNPEDAVYRPHTHVPGESAGAICRPHETLALVRCVRCGRMLCKPDGDPTAAWETVTEYICRKFPASPNSLI
ncbi:hypothetical protein [Fodinicola acaciae]|uniref:hypothetical protein n=1 Tax=Fodinicola acaciae TaxID=2681555 RepID=UPI0013D66735|nr:hypothetical protein [Fodinicola acaciae]